MIEMIKYLLYDMYKDIHICNEKCIFYLCIDILI